MYIVIRRVDKAHFSMKYDLKNFMEAEFARRNLYKQVQKESKSWLREPDKWSFIGLFLWDREYLDFVFAGLHLFANIRLL